MLSLPTLRQFYSLFPTEDACLAFLIEKNLFYTTIDCPSCGKNMIRVEKDLVFRCTSYACKGRTLSMKSHTFFYGSRLKCIDILELSVLWLNNVSVTSNMSLTGHSSNTVSNFYKFFRQLVSSAIEQEDVIIGGPGIVVEIDETKLGKRKYHRGHRVDGVWVVVGVEKTDARKMFAIHVENRSADVLENIVREHILPGSIIHSDMWKGYFNLDRMGYNHLVVNHSHTFKDFETGACTNTAEGTNNALKMKIPVRNRVRKNITDHLFEFIWRRKNNGNLFNAFIECIRDIHYD